MTIDVKSAEVQGFIRSLFDFDESGIPIRAIWHKDEVEYLVDTNTHYPTCRDLRLPLCLAGLDQHDKKLLMNAYMDLLIPDGDEFGFLVLPDAEFDASGQGARQRARSIISRMDQDFERRASQLSDRDRILFEAQRGSPSSQTIMGKACLRGWFGLEVDGKKATNWLSKAAAQGDPDACWELAHARVRNATTGADEYLIPSWDQRDKYKSYARSSGLASARKEFLDWQRTEQDFRDGYIEDTGHENRMLEIGNCLGEFREDNYRSLWTFVREIESEIKYRKAAFDAEAIQAGESGARRRALSDHAKIQRMYEEIPKLISIARSSLLEAAKHTSEASFLLADSDIIVDSWAERRDLLMKAAFPAGDIPSSTGALVEVAEMSLAKGGPDFDPARAMRCLELARASGSARLQAAVALRYADHLLTDIPERTEAVEEARRIYADEMEVTVYARLMHDYLELKNFVRGASSCATGFFSRERIRSRFASDELVLENPYVRASCQRGGVPEALMNLLSYVHTQPVYSWRAPLLEVLELWLGSVGHSHAAPFKIDASDVRALERIGSASNAAKSTSNDFAGICDDPIGDLGQSAEVVALVCNALASGVLDERSAYQLAVHHQSLIAGYLLVSWAALGMTTLAEKEVDEVIRLSERRAQSYARNDKPGFAGPDGESESARWFADRLSNCSIRYKNIVLEAKNRELLQARNEERQARGDVERRQRDLENLMSFVSHEFRGCVQSISDSAANEIAPGPSFFADQARKLSGYLELFSLMGSNPQRLKQKLRSDDSGPRDLEQTFDIGLWLALSQLLSPRGSGRISRHTLRHSIETGRVTSDATLKQWRITDANYRRVRQEVERDWSNQVRMLAHAGDLTPLRIWLSQFVVPLDISELKAAEFRFAESGSKECLLTIVMTEMLVNAVTYYDATSRLAVRMQWRENDAQACLVCTNPTSEAIRAESHGSHGGLDSLNLLAEKIGGFFSFNVDDRIATATFGVPADLIRGGDVVVSLG